MNWNGNTGPSNWLFDWGRQGNLYEGESANFILNTKALSYMIHVSKKFYLKKNDGAMVRSFHTAGEIVEYIKTTELDGKKYTAYDRFGGSCSLQALESAVKSEKKCPFFSYEGEQILAFIDIYNRSVQE